MVNQINAGTLLRRGAGRSPNKTAIIWEKGSLTYAELLRRVDRVSCRLELLGVRAGDRVALLLDNGPEFVETWWAVVQLGALVVPLSTRTVPREVRSTLNHSEANVVVADAQFLEMLLDLKPSLTSLNALIGLVNEELAGVVSYGDVVNGRTVGPPAAEPALTDPCAIYYTSGTTGEAKGVVRDHLSVTWGLSMRAQVIRADEVYLARAPMYHTGGSLQGAFAVLAAGATLVTMRQFNARALLEAVERNGITRIYVHPTFVVNALVDELAHRRYALRSLRHLYWTADLLSESTRARVLETFPGLVFENIYGMTEVSSIASYEHCGGPLKQAGCVGPASLGAELQVIDDRSLPAASGSIGEVVVRSPTAMRGYWRDPFATQQAMVGGWLHTGDLGYLDDERCLNLTGRKKDAITTGGETVYAAEVESVIATFPGVREVAVIGLPDPVWGEAVAAVVVVATQGEFEAADIISMCRRYLPAHKCPKQVFVVPSLPRSSVGKVLKRELIARYQ